MRWTRSGLISMLLAGVLVAGCAGGISENPKTAIGAAGGAAAGGLIGAAASGSPVAIASGVILGGLAGGAVGNILDQRDRQLATQAAHHALETAPSGTAVPWANPDNGHSGAVTPVRTYQAADGRYCREYQQTVTVGGQAQQSYGIACRQPDGSWRVAN